jgi:DNA-binding response OmpR family regulator
VDDTPENLDVVKGILGAADYVAKPIDPDTLLFSVRRQLNADGSDK